MYLLCLGNRDPLTTLPALDFLSHEIHRMPLSSASSRIPQSAEAIVLDATEDLRQARTACLSLHAQTSAAILVVIPEAALPALNPNWGLTDFVLPTASPAEVEGRLHLAVRLAEATQAVQREAVEVAGLVIDESSFTAKIEGKTLDLTFKEFELLRFLATNHGRVFTREQLLSEVWGTDYYGGTRTIDVHVRRLRAKLGDNEALIGTVRGVGYGFEAVDDEESTDEEGTDGDSPAEGVPELAPQEADERVTI